MRILKFRKFFKAGLSLGAGAAVGLLCTLFSAFLLADVVNRFQKGDLVSADQINANFTGLDDSIQQVSASLSQLEDQVDQFETDTDQNFTTVNQTVTVIQSVYMPPVGSIVAWHKNIGGAPSLPSGWVECSGGTVTDSASPLYNQSIPNLNSAPFGWSEGGVFLRGGTSSGGAIQQDQFQGHYHSDAGHNHSIRMYGGYEDGSWDYLMHTRWKTAANFHGTESANVNIRDASTGSHGGVRYGWETRPASWTVVWIMRIK